MSELILELVAVLTSAQPGFISLFSGAMLVLAVTARKPISIRAQKHRGEGRH